MCRIFGFVGESSPEVIKIINGLFLAEEKSNPHGTGFALLDKRGQFYLKKKGIRGLHFIARGYTNSLWGMKFKYFIGHVRYKTAGEQSDRNSHPFGSQVGNNWYFLIHNGVLGERMREIAKRFGANKISDVKVDSELFLRCITAQLRQGTSLIESIKQATYEVSDVGDFAFALLTKEGIYLWRNDYRPLSVFYYKDNIFFASTMDMWKEALKIAGVKAEKVIYTEIKPYCLYLIKLKNNKPTLLLIEENIPKKERAVVVKQTSKISKSSYSSYYDDYYSLFKDNKKSKTKPESKYNPFLFGKKSEEDYEDYEEDEENEQGLIDWETPPEYMNDTDLEEQIYYMEYYYHQIPDAYVEKKIQYENRLDELYRELHFRTAFGSYKEEVENEPF